MYVCIILTHTWKQNKIYVCMHILTHTWKQNKIYVCMHILTHTWKQNKIYVCMHGSRTKYMYVCIY